MKASLMLPFYMICFPPVPTGQGSVLYYRYLHAIAPIGFVGEKCCLLYCLMFDYIHMQLEEKF